MQEATFHTLHRHLGINTFKALTRWLVVLRIHTLLDALHASLFQDIERRHGVLIVIYRHMHHDEQDNLDHISKIAVHNAFHEGMRHANSLFILLG